MKKDLEDAEKAKKFIKSNKSLLIQKFVDSKIYKSTENSISLFMAGSPGAGKTEYSNKFIKRFEEPIVRIDADDIREIIPIYNGRNSDIVQGAASLGVEKLYDYVLKKRIDVIVDGTFAIYNISYRNIKRSIDKNRRVGIFYIYQDPLVAWELTKKREKLDGRMVPKDIFIGSLFAARENVNKIKSIFKEKVRVYLIIKNFSNNTEKSYFNIDNIDNYLKIEYTVKTLNNLLKDKI